MFSRYTCTYCGSAADQLDHVIPRSYTGSNSMARNLVVPSCSECNKTLGSDLITTVGSRASVLYKKYSKKYKKILKIPDWDADEIEELSPDMQRAILSGLSTRDTIRARLSFLLLVASLDPSTDDVWDSFGP